MFRLYTWKGSGQGCDPSLVLTPKFQQRRMLSFRPSDSEAPRESATLAGQKEVCNAARISELARAETEERETKRARAIHLLAQCGRLGQWPAGR